MNRYNTKKCKHCGKATSILAERTTEKGINGRAVFSTDSGLQALEHVIGCDSTILVTCRGCGAWKIARKVLGKVRNDIKCDGRCMSATGHNCECQCGGKNHGAAHAA